MNMGQLNKFQMVLDGGDELVMGKGMIHNSVFIFSGCDTQGV